jgi:hypothetical protein
MRKTHQGKHLEEQEQLNLGLSLLLDLESQSKLGKKNLKIEKSKD